MEAINKLRAMQRWFDMQCEYFNDQFKTLKQMEQVFDYSTNNNLEFMDNDYLFSGEITEEEKNKALKFLKKVIK